MSHKARAPETMRIAVKLAGSMAVKRSAKRHSNELAAKAIMASRVRPRVCVRDMASLFNAFDDRSAYPLYNLFDRFRAGVRTRSNPGGVVPGLRRGLPKGMGRLLQPLSWMESLHPLTLKNPDRHRSTCALQHAQKYSPARPSGFTNAK
jgi:hypothetical protein